MKGIAKVAKIDASIHRKFADNRITGKGAYKCPDGSTYEGEVKDGLRHGFGKYMVDDATYEGEWF